MTSEDAPEKPDHRGRTFTVLVAWFGRSREERVFALLADYASAFGASSTWRCDEDLRWAVHVLRCEPFRSEELRWATNLLARLDITPAQAKELRCRERH
ncbi:hypothetical protein AB0I28_20220 [Phytomonospora sp. NPDC050363]|uniref:hypothetical protein n=1 Tax=Phytomonospora sp. NPDC050363 TaxID=3155642 RepID=UPI0033EAC15D